MHVRVLLYYHICERIFLNEIYINRLAYMRLYIKGKAKKYPSYWQCWYSMQCHRGCCVETLGEETHWKRCFHIITYPCSDQIDVWDWDIYCVLSVIETQCSHDHSSGTTSMVLWWGCCSSDVIYVWLASMATLCLYYIKWQTFYICFS